MWRLVFVNLSAMNCQASRRTPKQLHRLASTNTPKMNKTNIPESIRFSQPGYRHAVSGRWRFLSTGGNPRPCLVRASVARGIMDGLRYTASWEPGFPFFGIVSPAAALYLSFRNWYTILICFCISVCLFLYFSQTSWISLSSGRALIFRLPT